MAIAVDVVAAEPDASAIATDELLKPSDGLTGGSIAKILGVELRAVAEAQDVLLRMLCQLDSLVQALG